MVTYSMWSVVKDYRLSKMNTGEAYLKEGKKFRYFFPSNTKRLIKGKKVSVTFKNGKIISYF